MQETTFNSPYQANGETICASIHLWLGALFNENEQINFVNLTEISSIKKLQIDINYKFNDPKILIKALTQSTFCYEYKHLNNSIVESNERLEFLGDSLVNLIIGKLLYQRYCNSAEGELSKLRGSLVNEHSLAQLAKQISLGENLLIGKGEYRNSGNLKESLLADAFEALIAAVFLDSNEDLKTVETVLIQVIAKYELKTNKDFFSLDNLESFDSKTTLQELVVSLYKIFPVYKSTETPTGFLVELWIGEKKIAEAEGQSKKKIEKELARFVLDEKKYQL